MKIGILIRDFKSLRDFELRIIEKILNDVSLELALFIKDGSDNKSSKNKWKRLLNSGNVFGILLFRLQLIIEKKIFRFHHLENRNEILDAIRNIPVVEVKPKRDRFFDIFSDEDSNKVEAYGLDILLRQGFGIIKGQILTAAKYGIWSFHHGDNAVNRGGPPAFWEIVLKEPVIGVTLQQLTNELDGGMVIEKGFYNTHWSVLKTNKLVLDQCVVILFKNIKKLQQNDFTTYKSPVYYKPLYKLPTISYFLKYLVHFYSKSLRRVYESFMLLVFHKKFQCWNLFIGNGDFMEATLHRLKPMTIPADEFWADPFLYEHDDNKEYIFFENYSYGKRKGKICCGRIEKNKLVDIVDVLEREYHLSYPFVFKEDGDLYMIPECSASKKVEILKCVKFPNEWQTFSTAFVGQTILDVTYYKDENNQRWLFLNKGYAKYHNSELYIYQIDSLKMEEIQEHTQNPVIIDSRKARNAGAIFKHNGKIIRPSQNNSNGIYGYGLNIGEIEKLSLTEYEEKIIISVYPDFKKNLTSVHHLSQGNNKFVIDGAFLSN